MPVYVVNHDNLDPDRSLAYATKKAAVPFSYQKRSLQSMLLLAISQKSTSLRFGKVYCIGRKLSIRQCRMTACRLKDQVSPYTLIVAHRCIDFVVMSHVPAKSMRSEPGERLAAEQIVSLPRNVWLDVWMVDACQ